MEDDDIGEGDDGGCCDVKTVADCLRLCGGRVVMVRYSDGRNLRLKDYLRMRKKGLVVDAGDKEKAFP